MNSVQVVEELLCENDESAHAWYLLSLAYYGGASFEEASETLQHGSKLIANLSDTEAKEVQAQYNELRERIQEGLQAHTTVK